MLQKHRQSNYGYRVSNKSIDVAIYRLTLDSIRSENVSRRFSTFWKQLPMSLKNFFNHSPIQCLEDFNTLLAKKKFASIKNKCDFCLYRR